MVKEADLEYTCTYGTPGLLDSLYHGLTGDCRLRWHAGVGHAHTDAINRYSRTTYRDAGAPIPHTGAADSDANSTNRHAGGANGNACATHQYTGAADSHFRTAHRDAYAANGNARATN